MSSTRRQIEQILNSIAWHADQGTGNGSPEYFTANPIIEVDYNGSSAQAMSALRQLSEKDSYSIRHINTNLVIFEESTDFVRAANIVTAYLYAGPGPHPANPTVIADLNYDFVRGPDGQWLISKQVAKFVFGGLGHLLRD